MTVAMILIKRNGCHVAVETYHSPVTDSFDLVFGRHSLILHFLTKG
jgi:hypothetical protein